METGRALDRLLIQMTVFGVKATGGCLLLQQKVRFSFFFLSPHQVQTAKKPTTV